MRVDFRLTITNVNYRLSDVDNRLYKGRYRELGAQLLVNKLHDGRPPKWFTSHRSIDSHELMVEDRYWLSIIYARVIPSTHDTEVTLDHILVIAVMLDGLRVNVGQIRVDQITEVAQGNAKSLVYPSLISRLHCKVGLSVLPTNEEKKPAKDIYPLKKRGSREGQKMIHIDIFDPSFG